MLLCDIGNTSYHFYDEERDYKASVSDFEPSILTETLYYISVNADLEKKLESLVNWIDLRPFIDWENYYETMGIDRVMACEAIENGVIIDAGSALTVDVVKNGVFEGGFITPGVKIMQDSYARISPRLDYSFNFDLDLDKMPKNSRDAISYGYLRLLYSEIRRHDGPLYITGGDAHNMAKLFDDVIIDELLIFKGMNKILEKAELC
ncbi:MAG: pantothenate kinase [Epsilonproteobacteria bacterium]|nr:MAG: pantothenate kinase [Campylobacterota bacterium]